VSASVRSSLEWDEFDEVVGEDVEGAPGAGAGVAAEAVRRHAQSRLRCCREMRPSAAGAPLNGGDKVVGVFDAGTRRRGLGGTGDHDRGHAGSGEVGLDLRVPVAAVGRAHRWRGAVVGGDPCDRRAQQFGVGGFPMCTE
jgi:hypothetical protein